MIVFRYQSLLKTDRELGLQDTFITLKPTWFTVISKVNQRLSVLKYLHPIIIYGCSLFAYTLSYTKPSVANSKLLLSFNEIHQNAYI